MTRRVVAVLAGALALAVAQSACAPRDAVQVRLEAHQPREGDLRRVEIRAQVTGPQRGLRYRWFSVLGECDPQESDAPSTAFRFGTGAERDRVTVEVWRDDERVALEQIEVAADARPSGSAERLPRVQVEITQVPRYEPEGGPDTRAEIAGRVSGELSGGQRVLIYARADAWYIQPTPYASHALRPDNTWASWTHTGSSYAALVVQPGFEPYQRLDVLPQVGGGVLARVVVDGARR